MENVNMKVPLKQIQSRQRYFRSEFHLIFKASKSSNQTLHSLVVPVDRSAHQHTSTPMLGHTALITYSVQHPTPFPRDCRRRLQAPRGLNTCKGNTTLFTLDRNTRMREYVNLRARHERKVSVPMMWFVFSTLSRLSTTTTVLGL